MIERGNHKSAKDDEEETSRSIQKDVHHGFAMPVRAGILHKIKGACIQPCGVTRQFSLQADGTRTRKPRLTHDLSHSLTFPKASVNSRLDMSQYAELIYGWCLTRIIHFIVALHWAFPSKRILVCKYDFSDACRRVAHTPKAAAQTILVVAGIAHIFLRLTFGGSANPPGWCVFSEQVTDLANELMLASGWDHHKVRSPSQPNTPVPTRLGDSEPLTAARKMAVAIPTTVTARVDGFMDDLISTFLDTDENVDRCPHAVPVAIFVSTRPHLGAQEPIPRRSVINESKLAAEGIPAEEQVVLGWELNTRKLLIRLPHNKFTAWPEDLSLAISTGKITFQDLDSMVG